MTRAPIAARSRAGSWGAARHRPSILPLAGCSGSRPRQAHNLKVVGSNPAPATNHTKINFAKAAPRGVKRGFCVSKTPYSAGFCGLPVHKALHRLPLIFDLLGVFGGILLKTSRLFQNDLQVVMCLIIKALIVRTFFEFYSITWLPNRQKNLGLVVVFSALRIPAI
jgi:hypothetical protein